MKPKLLRSESPWLLALLAALVALGPLSVDMYLPAMPQMMAALNTDIGQMHLTLSAYLTGFAVFHLACGPLADRFGRRPLLLGGTLLFIIACVGCALATTIENLLAYRFLQGIGACVGPTLAKAITRDIFGPNRAARALSLIAMLMALAPAVAPGVGGILLLYLPWSSIFIFLALYGCSMLILIYYFIAETLPAPQSLRPSHVLQNYLELLLSPSFLTVTIASSAVYGGLLMYLSSSSFIFIDMFGVPVERFGLIFINTVIGYIAGSAISARLSKSRDSEQVILYGAVLASIACLSMLGGNLHEPANIVMLIAPLCFYSAALGLILPHAMAMALRPFAHIAGTASALFGFVQMSIAATTTAVIGKYLKDSPLPMVQGMTLISICALVLAGQVYWQYRRKKGH
ncbi:MAG: DHA1 family bicyclomycin/chloramphenicol resistance-like MFS transporter [Alcanivorax sp.]|jgi:DHA1 family bicyclomycin/chloramphenicol resistance-like MFS transporter